MNDAPMFAPMFAALALALLVAALSVLAARVRWPAPIVMLLGGVAVSLVPGLPQVALTPEFVLMVLLPPLLYSSGVGMSWRGFRNNLRPILLLAVGCVMFTASAVAAVAHYVAGTSWAVGFVLGAVVSPPDPVAPMAILRRLSAPRRLSTVLEGEGLVNDATALVLLGFAIAAVTTGTVSLPAALGRFAVIVVGEVAFGVAIGWAALRLRHLANDPRAELMLSLATPFVAFWPAHLLGGSGVIACVACGLYVSWNGPALIRPQTRLQGFFLWDMIVWSVEAMVFVLMGTEARTMVEAVGVDEALELAGLGLVVAATVVVVRFVWVFPATYLPRVLSRRLRAREPFTPWQQPFLIAFTGPRGVVSIAAALSVPVAIGGRAFPDRPLILVTTIVVIAVTLVGLGGLLAPLVRALGVAKAGRSEAVENTRRERAARREGIVAVIDALDALDLPKVAPALASAVRTQEEGRLTLIDSHHDALSSDHADRALDYRRRLLGVERDSIASAHRDGRLTDAARRRIERELDLEENKIGYAILSVTEGGSANKPSATS